MTVQKLIVVVSAATAVATTVQKFIVVVIAGYAMVTTTLQKFIVRMMRRRMRRRAQKSASNSLRKSNMLNLCLFIYLRNVQTPPSLNSYGTKSLVKLGSR